jgi:mitochondrial cardiolipin hydrolase
LTTGSDIGRLRNAGVPVRVDRVPAHMHHKFVVLDNRFLLNGSFNWTRSAVLDNEVRPAVPMAGRGRLESTHAHTLFAPPAPPPFPQENVLILDSPAVATTYAAQFDRLWAKFA